MSEKMQPGGEQKLENIDTSGELKKLKEQLEARSEQAPDNKEAVPVLEKRAEQAAISGKEIAVGEREQPKQSSFGQQKDMKNLAYKRTLTRAQSQLSALERAFSKVVHHPVVEKVSNVGAQTVARPSGIMGGGLAAALGTGFVLFLGKTYGFTYNYLLFVLLFIAGFVLGLAVELILKISRRKKTTY